MTRALKSLKNLHLIGSFRPKYMMLALKSEGELSFMILESDEKIEEKLTCSLENDMTILANSHQSTSKP